MVHLVLAELLEVTSTSGRQADASQRTRAALAIASSRLSLLRQLYSPAIRSLPPTAVRASTVRRRSIDTAADTAAYRPPSDVQELTLLARFSAHIQAQSQANASLSSGTGAGGGTATACTSLQSNSGGCSAQHKPDVLECIARLSLCSSTSFTFGFMRRAWRTRDADDLEVSLVLESHVFCSRSHVHLTQTYLHFEYDTDRYLRDFTLNILLYNVLFFKHHTVYFEHRTILECTVRIRTVPVCIRM